jgi:CRP-like cAMP-binding protein
MLVKNSYRVAECYRRAAEARELSKRSATPDDRHFHLEMEKRWLQLAQQYSFGDRNQVFVREHQHQQALAVHAVGVGHANHLLAGLSSRAAALLEPALKRAKFVQGQILWDGGNLDHIYFPHSGAISLAVITHAGRMAEVGLVGPWGAFGLGMDVARGAATRAMVRVGGLFWTIATERMAQAAAQSEEIRGLIEECVESQLFEAQQLAACNAVHDARARLARLLLRYFDSMDGDVLPLTQDEIAQALGVYRTTVTSITELLKESGLISYKRGKITMLDRDGLASTACECYRIIRRMRNSHA